MNRYTCRHPRIFLASCGLFFAVLPIKDDNKIVPVLLFVISKIQYKNTVTKLNSLMKGTFSQYRFLVT